VVSIARVYLYRALELVSEDPLDLSVRNWGFGCCDLACESYEGCMEAAAGSQESQDEEKRFR
jgi:hypothetical protein